jgi:hypothetical protein
LRDEGIVEEYIECSAKNGMYIHQAVELAATHAITGVPKNARKKACLIL